MRSARDRGARPEEEELRKGTQQAFGGSALRVTVGHGSHDDQRNGIHSPVYKHSR